ncbi:glycosyltransferase family 4 protein [Providencia manganoxydans]|uniref:glycosyltransferase family 4 protein n=1 Tax=Providencia TaxID=586 RepID=UPI001D1624F6|nr:MULTISPECIES: glycosyltransferase family 4 protein [Providencia]
MLKICFFIGNLNNSGGTERITSVIANELTKKNYNVSILNLSGGEKPFFDLNEGVKIFQLHAKKHSALIQLPMTIFKLRRFLKLNKFDAIIDVDTMLSIYTIPAKLGIHETKHYSWEHFNYNVTLGKSSRKKIRNIAAYYADMIITLTEKDKSYWMENTTVKNICVIPNPITINPNNPHHRNLFPREKIILAVGRLTHQKGFDMLISSWEIISKQYPNWKLRIVGSGEDEIKLKNMIMELSLNSSVQIVPNTSNILSEYYTASYFVLSSRFEGFGLVILEAQACGLPVISFDCDAGPREIIQHDKSGWICKPNDIEELSLHMKNAIQLIESDFDSYKHIQENSIMNSNRFSIENILPLWIELLRK